MESIHGPAIKAIYTRIEELASEIAKKKLKDAVIAVALERKDEVDPELLAKVEMDQLMKKFIGATGDDSDPLFKEVGLLAHSAVVLTREEEKYGLA